MARKVERPQVALIGRPNVGKSTLFNRLTGTRLAITDELPGVTRDRLFGVCEWDGYELGVIDCGGIGPESEDPLWQPVADNAREAMKAADLILLITDVRTGLTLSDDALLKELRRLDTPVVVAVNKVDDAVHEADAYQFYSLGYSDVMFISALSGRCVGELLDLVVTKLDWSRWGLATPAHAAERYGGEEKQTAKKQKKAEASVEVEAEDLPEDYPFAWSEGDRPRFIPDESWRDDPVQLVFVGRQNVGKSSLTNALLGEERVLVNELAGTTRDPIWAEFTRGEQAYEVLDTAGMKRISRLKEDVDYYSLIRAEHGLRTSEVALLVLDAADGVMEQDKRVAAKIADYVRAVVIVVNKADLLPEGQPERHAYEDFVRDGLGKLPWAEVVFTSATEQKGLKGMLAAAVRSRENFHRRIDNNSLKMVLEEAVTLSPPPIVKNRELRFYDFRQIGNCPPTFLIEVNEKRVMRQAYRRYLYNTIRKHFDYSGTHIEMVYYIKRRRKRSR